MLMPDPTTIPIGTKIYADFDAIISGNVLSPVPDGLKPYLKKGDYIGTTVFLFEELDDYLIVKTQEYGTIGVSPGDFQVKGC